jgi:hypothetical protein
MGKLGEGVAKVLERVVLPERVALRDGERAAAGARLLAVRANGLLGAAELADRQARVAAAVTRGDLRAAVGDVPGAVPPARLVAALRVVGAATLALFLAQFAVWAVICAVSLSVQSPWWLFSTVPGGIAVAALGWAVESYHRPVSRRMPAAV